MLKNGTYDAVSSLIINYSIWAQPLAVLFFAAMIKYASSGLENPKTKLVFYSTIYMAGIAAVGGVTA